MSATATQVKTAKRLSDKVVNANRANAAATPDAEAQQLGAYLLSIGIANPVTK